MKTMSRLSTRNAARLPAPVERQFVHPATGEVTTLVYQRTHTGHVVRCEVPFGANGDGRYTATTDVTHARRMWRLIQSNLIRRGMVVVK